MTFDIFSRWDIVNILSTYTQISSAYTGQIKFHPNGFFFFMFLEYDLKSHLIFLSIFSFHKTLFSPWNEIESKYGFD